MPGQARLSSRHGRNLQHWHNHDLEMDFGYRVIATISRNIQLLRLWDKTKTNIQYSKILIFNKSSSLKFISDLTRATLLYLDMINKTLQTERGIAKLKSNILLLELGINGLFLNNVTFMSYGFM